MDTVQVIAAAERCAAAYRRGFERGRADNESKYYDESPLSGEWAGYSVRELLGDLLDSAELAWQSESESVEAELYADWEEITEHYLQGYRAAFTDADIVLCESCETLIHREQIGAGSALIESGERVYFCSDYCEK